MSYLVSARKFRPQKFREVVGQEHVTKPLSNAIARGKVPHALLFTGPRGVGKTSLARVFAKALNCTGRTIPSGDQADSEDIQESVEPCGDCTNCEEIARSTSIAVREIDGASNNSVDNVRELIESLRSLPPPGAKYKIYIIDEVHMLSTAAFNALLKSLEEPPPNTVFIFATTEPHKIPDTVISRCQRYDFRALRSNAIEQQLRLIADHEGISVEQEVLELIAKKAHGGMRDAQSMFDRLLAFGGSSISLEEAQKLFGVVDRGFFMELSQAVIENDAAGCFSLLDRAFSYSLDIRTFGADFLAHMRDVLLLSHANSKQSANETQIRSLLVLRQDEHEQLANQVAALSAYDAQRLFSIAEDTTRAALSSPYPRFVFEAGLAKMASLADLRPIPELIERLEKLEQAPGGHAVAPPPRQATPPSNDTSPEKKTVEIEETSPNGQIAFNPSWRDFVSHVQSRGEPVLCAHLRRVSPRVFTGTKLELETTSFDKEALSAHEGIEKLRRCLHSYSGIDDWTIQFHVSSQVSEPKENTTAAAPSARDNLAGSLADEEKKRAAEQFKKIEREARNDPAVRLVLSAFDGSKIEKISPVK